MTTTERWHAQPIVVRDGLGGIVLFVLAVLPLGVDGVALGELHRDSPAWVSVVAAALQTLPLALRRLRPAFALTIVGLAFAVVQLAGIESGVAGLGLFVALYSVAAHQRRHRLVVDLASLAAYVLLAVALHAAGSPETLVDWVTFFLVLLTPWFLGQLVRRRGAEQAIREAQVAATAVQDARNRLARDLHDVVTHHVTAMVVQAESAAYLDPADVAARSETLTSIGGAGRRALQELRSLLGALEQPAAGSSAGPPPGGIADLVERQRAAGQVVTMTATGPTDDVSDAVASTLYRIAQEALTNALRHAPGSPVVLTVAVIGSSVSLTVSNAVGDHRPGSVGRGRRGMAERAALLGGEFDASVVGDRFVVQASMDVGARP